MRYKIEIINRRRKILGAAILCATLLALAFGAWVWWNMTVNFNERVVLYFEDSVHGLSVGSDVRMNGQKIGQVESVRIRQIPGENDFPNYYACVSTVVDMRKFHRCTEKISDDVREDVSAHVASGLRARLLLPSILAPGLSVEFFFAPGVPAKFAHDPENAIPEIPTRSKGTSARVDSVNRLFKSKDLENLGKRIHLWESRMKEFDDAVSSIDFARVNSELGAKADALAALADAEKFHEMLVALNANLSALNAGVKNGDSDVEEHFRAVAEQMRFLREKISALNDVVAEINSAFTGAVLGFEPEEAEKMRRTLKKISYFAREFLGETGGD